MLMVGARACRCALGASLLLGLCLAFMLIPGVVAAEPSATAVSEPGENGPDASQADLSVEEVTECMERNLPQTTSVQTIQFVHVDRAGGRGDLCRAKICGKRFEDNRRKMRLRYLAPSAFRNIRFMGHERDECHDMWVWRPSERRVRRLPCGGGGTIPCSDFSGEDLMRLMGMEPSSHTERLPDELLNDRDVYVLSSTPTTEAQSQYDRVMSYVDKETCVVLKEVSYVAEDAVKLLMVRPESIEDVNGHFVATKLRMDDLIELTHTEVEVEEIEIDRDVRDRCFDEKTLPQTCCR